MKIVHILTSIVLSSVLAGALHAEPGNEPANAFKERASAQIAERFKRGDVNGDGRLTRDEARNSMPRVYENFDQIDLEKTGYVTLEQIKQFSAALMAERKKQ